MRVTKAPYNFIPFSDQVICRYSRAEDLPGHDTLDPKLLSGEIHLTLTADTPVCVGGDKKNRSDRGARPAKAADGSYQIPGSTLRGLIRENMQILSLGLVRPGVDFENIRMYYRDFASGRDAVSSDLRRYYRGVAQNAKGGYLCRTGKYTLCIRPVFGQVLRLRRSDPLAAPWKEYYAFQNQVWFKADGETVTEIYGERRPGCRPGVLMSPGRMQRQNSLYLFPEEDRKAPPIPISEEEELSYLDDFKRKYTTLKGDRSFWNLPKVGEKKAVFYIRRDGFTSFGVSKYLRIGYKYPLSHGLPQSYREVQEPFLDYPNSILGFAGKTGCYRSRVQVGDLKAKGDPVPMEPVTIILASPKPTFQAAYVAGGGNYNRDNFQLGGYKQYWLKDPVLTGAEIRSNVGTQMQPLPRGTQFSGVIRYRNLHPDELGLLLWCLRLDEGCFQSVGMGKPYGYGRVKVSIDSLQEWQPGKLYASLTAGPAVLGNTEDRVEELICAYDRYACLQTGEETTLRDRDAIQDFLYMKKTVRRDTDQVSYMGLNEHRNLEVPLPAVKEIRRDG